MNKFILSGLLLLSSVALAEYAGELNMNLDGTVLSAVSADAGAPVKIDAGTVVVEMTAMAVTGSVDAGDAGSADAGVVEVITPSLDAPLMSAKGFFTAVKTGNGWLAAMFMLFFFVGAMRVGGKWLHKMIPDDTKNRFLAFIEAILFFFFDTKLGGWILNWLSAIGGCLSTAAMAGMPVDMASWKVAIMASTAGTALIELKDDVMEWWTVRQEKKAAEAAAKAAVVAPAVSIVPPPPAIPPVEPPKP